MLQTLLEDRFKLAVRRESKNLLVYALMVARDGLRLPETREGNCAAFNSDKPLPLPAPARRFQFPAALAG